VGEMNEGMMMSENPTMNCNKSWRSLGFLDCFEVSQGRPDADSIGSWQCPWRDQWE